MAFVHITTGTRNDACDAVVDRIDAGTANSAGAMHIYADDGDGIPASANTAITNQTKLAEIDFANPAFGDASGGVATAFSITKEDSALATGTAAFARIVDRDVAAVKDVDVGETGSGSTVELGSVSIVVGGDVEVTSATITMPSGES